MYGEVTRIECSQSLKHIGSLEEGAAILSTFRGRCKPSQQLLRGKAILPGILEADALG